MSSPVYGCLLADCSYTEDGGSISCSPGGDDCSSAVLQTAYKSAFHDDDLRNATEVINEKLYKLAKKPPAPGLKLSFLWSPRGVFLAWVKHEDKPPTKGVRREHGLDANDAALGLYPHPYHPGF
ncbi:MAG: hypothetical protein ACRD6X_21435 [Pyrinomonadaceae bacterium]